MKVTSDNSNFPKPQVAGLKIYHADDPDPEKAGQGLGTAPLLENLFPLESLRYWQMSPSEQMGLIYLLQQLRPKVAIEIGTRFGGSLQVLAKYCEKVYSLDIDPEVPARMAGQYKNVEYLIGPSTQTLPALLQKLTVQKAELAFVLVDGDHSAQGVRADINAILQFKPIVPLYVVMHDSFNPECRVRPARRRVAGMSASALGGTGFCRRNSQSVARLSRPTVGRAGAGIIAAGTSPGPG